MGNFMDKVFSLVGVDMGNDYNEEYYDDYRDDEFYDEPMSNEEYMPSRRHSVRSNSRVNRLEDTPQMKLVIMNPKCFEDSMDIINYLKERKPVVINLEEVDDPVSRRVVDFVSGAVYALDADIKKVANKIFLIAPCDVGVMTESKGLSGSWQHK